ncbi:MAG: phosphatase PAP2 family protein [Erysipelotrichaceae bacterium]|nr:phosphatase PAP2 family protein [Erysipelotrichaceae bacterium]
MTGNVFQFAWEVRLIEWIQHVISLFPFLEYVFEALTFFGEPVIPVLVFGMYYLGLDKQKGRKLFLNIIFAQVLSNELKNIVKRVRPYFANDTIKCLRPAVAFDDAMDIHLQGYSFPSGHTTQIFNLTHFFIRENRKRSINVFWIIVSILVAISRFSLGVHYPTDVLAGALIGVLSGFVICSVFEKFGEKAAYLLVFVFAIPGFFFCTTKDFHSVLGILIGFYFGDMVEKKYVNFSSTDNKLEALLRVIGASLVFAGLNTLLKMLLSNFNLDNTWVLRTSYVIRYAIGTFLAIGIYPRLFKYLHFPEKKEA